MLSVEIRGSQRESAIETCDIIDDDIVGKWKRDDGKTIADAVGGLIGWYIAGRGGAAIILMKCVMI